MEPMRDFPPEIVDYDEHQDDPIPYSEWPLASKIAFWVIIVPMLLFLFAVWIGLGV